MPAKRKTVTPRKRIRITKAEKATVQEFARLNDMSVPDLFRGWQEKFLERGSDYSPDSAEIEYTADPDKIALAEAKAREEYGCSLRDIFRHEIAQISVR